jgi:hypothetical protein
VAEVVLEAPTIEVPAVEAPAVETAVPEAPPVQAPIIEEPGEEGPDRTVAPVLEPRESEFIITSDSLEEPLPGSGWEPSPAIAVDEETIEDVLPMTPDEFELYEPAEVERQPVEIAGRPPVAVWSEPEIEAPVAEPEEVGAVEAETPPAEISWVETPVFEPPVVEPVVAAGEAIVEMEEVAEITPVDDLKIRIEETRRRIRRELEQPFISRDEIEEVADWTTSPVIPVVEETVVSEPAVAESLESVPDTVVFEDEAEAVAEEGVDYESMRSRIEMTRSRLKAKAFDAMMMGEAALLGRDSEDAEPKQPVAPAVDSEIDQTVETSLREQED